MIGEKLAQEPTFVFFTQKETIYYQQPINQIQAQVEKELEQNPNDIKNLIILAQIISKFHAHENQSLLIYKKVLQLDPKNIDARLDLVMILIQRYQFIQSQQILEECFKIDDQYWRVYYSQSLMYILSKQQIKAKVVIEKANIMFPKEPWITILLTQQLSEFSQYSKRVSIMIDNLIQNHILDYEMMLRFAYMYRILKNYELQEIFLLKAISINPNSQKANNNLGNFYRSIKKDYDKCIEYCLKAIELDPFYEVSYYNLSVCYQSKSDYNKSIYYLQKCLQINMDNDERLEDLIQNSYLYLNDIDYTLLILNHLIKKHPKNQYGLYFFQYLLNNKKLKNTILDNEIIEQYQISLLNVVYSNGSDYDFIEYNNILRFVNKLYENTFAQ